MFIELHDVETCARLLVNANEIGTIIELSPDAGKTMLILSGGLDTWRYVRESYEEIKMMLTNRLIQARSPEKGVMDLLNRISYGSDGRFKQEDN